MSKLKEVTGLDLIDILHFMNILTVCLIGDILHITALSYLICAIYSFTIGLEKLLPKY